MTSQVHIGQGDGDPLLLPDGHQRAGDRVSVRVGARHPDRRDGGDGRRGAERDSDKRGPAPRNFP